MIDFIPGLDFIGRALLAGLAITIVTGPLGSVMVWRRMSYFGDTLAHSTLFGVTLALLLNINIYIGLIAMCLVIALLLSILSKQKKLPSDAILGMLSHLALALGLIAATSISSVRVNLLGYLFGDILSVTAMDIYWIFIVDIVVIGVLFYFWRLLLSITIQEDLAKIEGVPVELTKLAFLLIIALVFAIAMRLVGVLLITALLIIPASASRLISKSPEQMAIFASILGMLSVGAGIGVSLSWDIPTGPSIVVCSAGVFLVCLLGSKFRRV